MIKFLRYSFLLTLMMLFSASYAQKKVVFDATVDKSESADAGACSITKDGVTISITNGILGNGANYRIYAGAKLTISSDDKNVTKVVLTCAAKGDTKYGPGCLGGEGYTFEVGSNEGTWTGDAKSIELASTGKQTRATVITVYTGNYSEGEEPVTELVNADDFKAFKALASGTEANLKLTNAQVLYVKGSNMYVRDASGALEFYKSDIAAEAGKVLNGSIIGRMNVYKKSPQFTTTAQTNLSTVAVTDGSAQAVPVEATVVSAVDYLSDLVAVKDVTVKFDENGDYYAYQGADSIMIYDKFAVANLDATDAETTYSFSAIVLNNNGVFELAPIVALEQVAEVTTTIAELNGLTADKANITLNLTNAKVVATPTYIKNDKTYTDYYVREGDKAIIFYNMKLDIKANDVLNGKVMCDYANYYGIHEVKSNANTTADKLTITSSDEAAQPVVATVTDLAAQNHLCDLVKIENVKIEKIDKYYYAVEGDAKVQIYDKYGVAAIPETLDGTYTITGVIGSIMKGVVEIYPTMSISGVNTGISNITTAKANLPVYNLAGQRVNKSYKGLQIIGGKKYMIRK